jgi:glycosyltransferase involved in cell wall biosynthesis
MKILTIVDYYLPGYRAGGPLRTICNMVDSLANEHKFLILTRDRDLGDQKPYPNIKNDEWSTNQSSSIFYASPEKFSLWGLRDVLNKTDYDIIYLNSFFSPLATSAILLLSRLRLIEATPILIAPRGEFSAGALKIKWLKKIIYIYLTKALYLYKDLYWQASSIHEANDISRVMGSVAKKIIIAPDLISPSLLNSRENKSILLCGNQKELRVIFISRIDPKKNLDFLLNILSKVNVLIKFSICGPIGDRPYWEKCKKLIDELPKNIKVNYLGGLPPDKVPKIFSQHDVFFFPTHGENFGHVIYESLAAGTAVVLSDRTPWKSCAKGGVEIIPLNNLDAWVASLKLWGTHSQQELAELRVAASSYAENYYGKSPALELNRTLFKILDYQLISKNSGVLGGG